MGTMEDRPPKSPTRKPRTKSAAERRSLEAQQARRRVLGLTGSDQIRVNDQDYMSRLRAKVMKEYEAEEARAEKERAEAERVRMRRLLARGLVGPQDIREDKVLYKEWAQNRALWDTRWKTKRSPERYVIKGTRSPDRVNGCRSLPPEDRFSAGYIRPSSTMTSSRSRASSSRTVSFRETSPESPKYLMTTDLESRTDSTGIPDPERGSLYSYTTSSRPDSRVRSSNRPGSSRYEHPVVQQMRREESVEGLYRLAEEVVVVDKVKKKVVKKYEEEEDTEDFGVYKPAKGKKKAPRKLKF